MWSGGLSAIRFWEIGNPVFSVSFNNSLVEEVCVSIPLRGPFLFGSLAVVLFLFGSEVLMLVVEMFLE